MEYKFTYNSNDIIVKRYPKTTNSSLRAFSNAELLVLDYIKDFETRDIYLFNDRFGVWNCALSNKNLTTIWTYASQKKAILQNLKLNALPIEGSFKTPLEDLQEIELALIKIPKSLELFELFLSQIHEASSDKTKVVCGFMTKYFSPSYVKIAERYFHGVTQSKAWKKARLLLLSNPKKERVSKSLVKTISWNASELKQYFGVFSSGGVDSGTQFLLKNLSLKEEEVKVLDLASGNGIIANEILNKNTRAHLTLVDDFNLAIASSQLNVKGSAAHFICEDSLSQLPQKSFDLVVSNPPFHFEHENNIEITLRLFKEVKDVLKNNGRFLLVANRHLNYSTQLSKLFDHVVIVRQNEKFQIISCIRS